MTPFLTIRLFGIGNVWYCTDGTRVTAGKEPAEALRLFAVYLEEDTP